MANDKAVEMMKAVWIKAFLDGELMLNFPSKADSVRARFMLYNVSKTVKNGKRGENFDLEAAVEECMINVTSDTQFVVRHKALAPLIQCIGAQLGIDPATLHVPDETDKAAEESLRRFMAGQEEAQRAAQENEGKAPTKADEVVNRYRNGG